MPTLLNAMIADPHTPGADAEALVISWITSYDDGVSTFAGSHDWSKLLFNNSHLLGVAAAISTGDGMVDSKALQLELLLGQSTVHRVLRVFEGVGLLERQVRSVQTEPVRYLRIEHRFWESASDLHDNASSAGSAK